MTIQVARSPAASQATWRLVIPAIDRPDRSTRSAGDASAGASDGACVVAASVESAGSALGGFTSRNGSCAQLTCQRVAGCDRQPVTSVADRPATLAEFRTRVLFRGRHANL